MDKKDNKGDLEADNLSFNKVVFNADGSVLIIGQEYYVVSHTYSDGKTTHTSYTFHYDDILVLKADKNGKALWCKKISKNQSSSNPTGLSYCHHNYKGEDYFFYIDYESSGNDLTCVKIDGGGEMTKKAVFNLKQEEVRVYPRMFELVTDRVIVDRIKEDKKESKILRIEIK